MTKHWSILSKPIQLQKKILLIGASPIITNLREEFTGKRNRRKELFRNINWPGRRINRTGDKYSMSEVSLGIGNLYYDLEDFAKALTEYKKGLATRQGDLSQNLWLPIIILP